MKASCLLVALGSCLSAPPVGADSGPADDGTKAAVSREALFPGAGRASVALSTGVPFWVMGELSFGVGEHAAIGILAGATPKVSGFGLRPRAELPLADTWSLLGVTSALYYPPSGMSREWWLVRPSLLVNRRLGGASLAVGAGAVAAATSDKLFGSAEAHPAATSPYPSSQPRRFDSGAWLTANVIASVRLSKATHFLLDGALVFDRHLSLALDGWVGGPPAIVFLGVETAL